jgi:hypothetical protein
MELPAFYRLTQRLAGREQMFLTDEFVERARPHAICQRAQW